MNDKNLSTHVGNYQWRRHTQKQVVSYGSFRIEERGAGNNLCNKHGGKEQTQHMIPVKAHRAGRLLASDWCAMVMLLTTGRLKASRLNSSNRI
jgi:hypothetical protein